MFFANDVHLFVECVNGYVKVFISFLQCVDVSMGEIEAIGGGGL